MAELDNKLSRYYERKLLNDAIDWFANYEAYRVAHPVVPEVVGFRQRISRAFAWLRWYLGHVWDAICLREEEDDD